MAGPWDASLLPMPVFLLFACFANFAFLWKSMMRLKSSPHSVFSRALVGQAVGELCWVLPCFVQCFITLANGEEGDWFQGYLAGQGGRSTGCNVMGFYSMFSLIAGMGTTVVMAWLSSTPAEKLPSVRTITWSLVAMIPVALFYGMVPLVGIGAYKFSSPICYFDWYDPAHAVLILLWTLPMLVLGCGFLLRAALKRPILFLHLTVFVLGWGLWPPAALIGLSGADMPNYFMIVGGVLGHGQALVNPLLYGIIWNSQYTEEVQHKVIDMADGKAPSDEEIGANANAVAGG